MRQASAIADFMSTSTPTIGGLVVAAANRHTGAMMSRSFRLSLARSVASIAVAGAVFTASGPTVSAQTLTEMVTVTAIQGTLNSVSVVNLPTGSAFVKNPHYAHKFSGEWLGTEAAKWKDFELYIARGLVKNLADAYAQTLASELAVKGFFGSGSKTTTVNGEVRSQTVYDNPDTGAAMLILINKKSDGVYILVGKKK
jgi:hypothetical protein